MKKKLALAITALVVITGLATVNASISTSNSSNIPPITITDGISELATNHINLVDHLPLGENSTEVNEVTTTEATLEKVALEDKGKVKNSDDKTADKTVKDQFKAIEKELKELKKETKKEHREALKKLREEQREEAKLLREVAKTLREEEKNLRSKEKSQNKPPKKNN